MGETNSLKQELTKELGQYIHNMVSEICNKDYDLLKECSWPFMPYIGSEYYKANPRILIIGKATNGWGNNGSIECTDEFINNRVIPSTDEFINNRVIPYFEGAKDRKEGYYSSFLQRIYIIALALLDNKKELPQYQRNSEQSQKCFNSIAWTNFFKIGSEKNKSGLPSAKLKKIIEDQNKKALNAEIEILKPTIIIFSTGHTYDEYLKDFLCIKDIDSSKDITEVKINGFNGVAFRTKHFQTLSNEQVKNLYTCIRNELKN